MILSGVTNMIINGSGATAAYLGGEQVWPVNITGVTAITYTSTDGNIVTPYNTTGWGATIVSNTYENGVGKIAFSEEITTVPRSAFLRATKLSTISIADTVTSIGQSAFEGCSALTGITIPNSVIIIDNYAFRDCVSLWNITIPDSVTTINLYAFGGCNRLYNISIGTGVTTIGTFALYDLDNLTNIRCYATNAPTVSYDTFYSISRRGTLHYPSGSDYSSWLSNDNYYLGYYGWTGVADL